MILATMAVLAAAPTLAAVDSLPPKVAGEIALAGQDHAPIVRITAPKAGHMGIPGTVERQMIERPVADAEGCFRKRWTVRFRQREGLAEREAELSDASAIAEVALPAPAGCPDDGYVHVNPGLEPAQALAELSYLDEVRLRGAPVRFTCADETPSKLCVDPTQIRQALAKLTPWAVTHRDGDMVFWLDGPGGAVTEVRYRLPHTGEIAVSRRIPAPF
jgi:hypothetical protein